MRLTGLVCVVSHPYRYYVPEDACGSKRLPLNSLTFNLLPSSPPPGFLSTTRLSRHLKTSNHLEVVSSFFASESAAQIHALSNALSGACRIAAGTHPARANSPLTTVNRAHPRISLPGFQFRQASAEPTLGVRRPLWR